ncbi:MAG: hypothetical protein AAF583_13135, partial [Pseudomonadota bacterium]
LARGSAFGVTVGAGASIGASVSVSDAGAVSSLSLPPQAAKASPLADANIIFHDGFIIRPP